MHLEAGAWGAIKVEGGRFGPSHQEHAMRKRACSQLHLGADWSMSQPGCQVRQIAACSSGTEYSRCSYYLIKYAALAILSFSASAVFIVLVWAAPAIC